MLSYCTDNYDWACDFTHGSSCKGWCFLVVFDRFLEHVLDELKYWVWLSAHELYSHWVLSGQQLYGTSRPVNNWRALSSLGNGCCCGTTLVKPKIVTKNTAVWNIWELFDFAVATICIQTLQGAACSSVWLLIGPTEWRCYCGLIGIPQFNIHFIGLIKLLSWFLGLNQLHLHPSGLILLPCWLNGLIKLPCWLNGPIQLHWWLFGLIKLYLHPFGLNLMICGLIGRIQLPCWLNGLDKSHNKPYGLNQMFCGLFGLILLTWWHNGLNLIHNQPFGLYQMFCGLIGPILLHYWLTGLNIFQIQTSGLNLLLWGLIGLILLIFWLNGLNNFHFQLFGLIQLISRLIALNIFKIQLTGCCNWGLSATGAYCDSWAYWLLRGLNNCVLSSWEMCPLNLVADWLFCRLLQVSAAFWSTHLDQELNLPSPWSLLLEQVLYSNWITTRCSLIHYWKLSLLYGKTILWIKQLGELNTLLFSAAVCSELGRMLMLMLNGWKIMATTDWTGLVKHPMFGFGLFNHTGQWEMQTLFDIQLAPFCLYGGYMATVLLLDEALTTSLFQLWLARRRCFKCGLLNEISTCLMELTKLNKFLHICFLLDSYWTAAGQLLDSSWTATVCILSGWRLSCLFWTVAYNEYSIADGSGSWKTHLETVTAVSRWLLWSLQIKTNRNGQGLLCADLSNSFVAMYVIQDNIADRSRMIVNLRIGCLVSYFWSPKPVSGDDRGVCPPYVV